MRAAVLRKLLDSSHTYSMLQCYRFGCRKDYTCSTDVANLPQSPQILYRNISFTTRHYKLLLAYKTTGLNCCSMRSLNNISHDALEVSHHDPSKMKHQSLFVRFISKKDFEICVIAEDDLEERFVKGSGPGGQSVQKTANCVVLKHKPTGIIVKCHQERSLEVNRKIARKRLVELVDRKIHGENSYFALKEKEEREKIRRRKLEAKFKAERKRALKLEKAALLEQVEEKEKKDEHDEE